MRLTSGKIYGERPMADYDPENFKPGEMNLDVQNSTFDGFMKTCVIVCAATVFVLLFLLVVAT